jgi:RNA polymerase sigma factor (TIGR02999 family)
MQPEGEITILLERWRAGDAAAFDRLAPAVYDHLHEVAAGYLACERSGHTLQATGLVHELFLKLLGSRAVHYHDRTHFFTFAAKVMRRILVDHARRSRSQKRGDGAQRVPLAEALAWVDARSADMLDLDAALDELAELDELKVKILELRFFLGTTGEEAAELLGFSKATVDRAMRFSITWLHQRLTQTGQTQNIPE